MKVTLTALKRRLADVLIHWGTAILPQELPELPESLENAETRQQTTVQDLRTFAEANTYLGESIKVTAAPTKSSSPSALCPAVREPLSVENAVLGRDMTVLKREAADALAALGAAHALVTSARLAQLNDLRSHVEAGQVSGEVLMTVAADYQGWQNDQVRLFDALALVLRTRVPNGNVMDQVDPNLHEQAKRHLEALSTEYQRGLLSEQFRDTNPPS